jgi:DNA-binding MarR family transcriptional regulator
MTSPPFNPLDSLVFLTIRVGKLLVNRFKEDDRMESHDFHPHHMGILVDLWTRDGVRQQDLAISSIKDKSSITRSLNVLEKQNILVRIPDPKDKRTKRIFLTHKGKQLQEELEPMARAAIQQAISGIDPEQVDICKRVLKSMYENLNR